MFQTQSETLPTDQAHPIIAKLQTLACASPPRPRGSLSKLADFQTFEADCVEFSYTILLSHASQTKPDHARLSDLCFSCCFQQPRTEIHAPFRTLLPVTASSYLQYQTLPSFLARHQVFLGFLSSIRTALKLAGKKAAEEVTPKAHVAYDAPVSVA